MTYAIKAPARYAQGAGELANLGRSAKKLGNKFLVICTDNSRGRFGAQVEASLAEQEKEVVFTTFHGEATKDEVFAKMDECRAQGCDVVVGMGGGKALDTAKAVAENLGLPCVIIPTVASNDAPCSGVAVLYNDAGVVIKAVLMRRNPDLVLVDTGIIANAPRRLFAAGLGDALSTWFEARACKNSGARTMARGNVSNTGLMMARLCYDLLMEKGRDALAAVERHEVTPALEDVVEATIYLSGLGFENGGLAAAHAVNDGFAQEPQAHGMYHGEKVENGLAVIADCQTGGRGRRGRSFLSPAGKGLYLSVLMQPRCSVDELSMLTAWSAVALCSAVERACGVRPGIKWPNDLVMQNRKLCGVLTELEVEAETGLPRYVIVGIGTNVLQTEADFGPEVAPIAISLEQALGQAPARTALAKEILRAMDDLYRDFPQEKAQYLEQYRRDCLTLGRPVTVLRSSGARNGFATGINEDFSLTVRWEDGTEEALSAGEVSVRGLYGYV